MLAFGALALYTWSNPEHYNQYNHFVWQADAFLHGKVSFDWPVPDGADRPPNWYFNDIYPLFDASGQPTGQVLLPFPPLPGARAAAVRRGDRAARWTRRRSRSPWRRSASASRGGCSAACGSGSTVRALATVLFATGTVWWWAAAVGSTWYLAHLVAVIARCSPSASPCATTRAPRRPRCAPRRPTTGGRWLDGPPSGRSTARRCLPGLLLGIAATARLPLVFAAPFLILVGGGGTRARRPVSAAVGGVLPVAALLLYTYLTTGSWLHPGYDYQYQLEANGYPTLGYHPDWSVEDLRYIPQNLGIMFGALPVVAPDLKPNTLGFGDPVVPVRRPPTPSGRCSTPTARWPCRSTSAPASC